MKNVASRAVWVGATAVFLMISGCASGPKSNPTDPLEPMNRAVYRFNEGVDKAVLKPVAEGYKTVTPRLVRQGVSNFFDNLEDLWSGVNGVFQLRPQVAVDDFLRVAVNTFLGLGGVLDIASEAGIERHNEDFGKTLGRWGVPAGPYVVLPLLGPSTLRDTAALGLDNRGDAVTRGIDHVPTRNSLYTLRAVDTRTNLLRLGELLDDVALDKYSFTRDAFLQKRRASIFRPGQEDDDLRSYTPPEK